MMKMNNYDKDDFNNEDVCVCIIVSMCLFVVYAVWYNNVPVFDNDSDDKKGDGNDDDAYIVSSMCHLFINSIRYDNTQVLVMLNAIQITQE